MANKDEDMKMDIIVGAVADEKSAEQATKNIIKKVDSTVKDGRINIPVDITVPIDKTKSKLTKAQKDITTEIEKMTSKGFSASGKDIDVLTSKLNTFINEAKEAGKDNRNPIVKAISQQVKNLQNQYKELIKVEKINKAHETKINKSNKSTSSKKTAYDDYLSKQETYSKRAKEIREKNEKEDTKFITALEKGAGRGKASTPGTDINLGYRQSNWDDTYNGITDKKGKKTLILKNDKLGTYYGQNDLMRSMIATEKLNRKASVDRHKVDETTANQMAEDARKRGNNKNNFTPQERAKGIASAILPELAKVLGGIQYGREDSSPDKFFKMLETVLKLNQDAGVKALSNASSVLNMTLHKWFSIDKTLGVNDETTSIDQTRAPQVEAVLKDMIARLDDLKDTVIEETIALEQETKTKKQQSARPQRGVSENSVAGKIINQTKLDNERQGRKLDNITNAMTEQSRIASRNYIQDIRESSREGVADTRELRVSEQNKIADVDVADTVKADYISGMNTDSSAAKLFEILQSIKDTLKDISQSMNMAQSSLSGTLQVQNESEEPEQEQNKLPSTQVIDPKTGQFYKSEVQDQTEKYRDQIRDAIVMSQESQERAENAQYNRAKQVRKANARRERLTPTPITEEIRRQVEEERGQVERGEHERQQRRMESLSVTTSPKGFWNKLKKTLEQSLGSSSEVERIMAMNSAQQDRLRAERIATYGENKGRDLKETGSKAAIRYIKTLFGWNYKNDKQNQSLFQDVKLTSPADVFQEIDTSKIMEGLNKVLSGSQMFNAQTGGVLRNIIGSMTGYIGMPSIEKSRSQADALNQILSDVRKEVLALIQDIQAKESALRGMEDSGRIKFDKEGRIADGDEKSIADATKILADLEEQKGTLKAALAEVNMIDQVVDKTGGKIPKIIRHLGFVMPELMKENTILQNINAGLDKNGRALKFQSRTAEILNYSFQLMSRSIGQMYKNWMVQLNPITQIKKAFSDFMSYDVKWKRTLNVIKYNLRSILRPFMEWIAQKLVNIIGFIDIISQKVQKAFKKIPISLFDQAAAQTEKMHEELEAAANVTAGFDELHDIGSDNSAENDLMGEIYKPQLSKEWEDLANKIGDLFAGIITGDMGFSDVMTTILDIAWKSLGILWGYIKDLFTNTVWPFIKKNWLEILGWVAGAFLAWSFLKTVKNLLWNAIFGSFTQSAIGGLFGKVGGWILGALSSTGISAAFQMLFTGGKYSLIGTLKEMFTNSAMITEANSWGSMIGFAVTKGLIAVLGGYATYKITEFFGDRAVDNENYNLGLTSVGGDEKDKKSNIGNVLGGVLGGIGGGAITGAIVGGVPGAIIGGVIGGIAGTIQTVLRPALEEAEVAARNMNNELQNINYYEGAVQGVSTQVSVFDEQLKLLKQSLQDSTQSIYDQGEKLGISKTRMDELVKATQDGSFHTDMLTSSETGLADSLTSLAQKQEHVTEVSKKLEEAQQKLLKAQTELSIAQDVEAGNFELAAARIELAEAQGVYSTEQATAKRIQLYKLGSREERDNLLQNLTNEQTKRMGDYLATTQKGLGELSKAWGDSSDDVKQKILDAVGPDTQNKIEQNMNSIDAILQQHQSVWQKIGDTLAEIFTLGNATTWTYNKDDKYYEDAARAINNDPSRMSLYSADVIEELKKRKLIKGYAVGTNYVPNDGLAYLHQGEAVIPKKYNTPYQQDNSGLENAISQLAQQVSQISSKVDQGINVKGQFVQKGSDLVATVQKANNKLSNTVLNNKVYAR